MLFYKTVNHEETVPSTYIQQREKAEKVKPAINTCHKIQHTYDYNYAFYSKKGHRT